MPAIDPANYIISPSPALAAPSAAAPSAAAPQQDSSGFSFRHLLSDLFDIVNPLEHLPVVSTLYEHLTGHEVDTPEKIMGDTLYGGPLGFICSLGDTIFKAITGKDVGDTVYAFVTGQDSSTALASNAATVAPAESISISPPSLSGIVNSLPQIDFAQRAYRRAVSLLPN